MIVALDRPALTGVLTQWTLQPLAILVAVLLAGAYVVGVRRLDVPWSRGRSAVFALGLALLVWTSCGFPGVYARSLFWVWTSQTLILWLLVPITLLFGHPIQLALAVQGPDGRLARIVASKPVQIVSNPLVGPALVPILSFVVFFGPVPAWSIRTPAVGWALQLALVLIGAMMVLALVGLEDDVSSLAVALGLAIGSIELVLDAVPGLVMRLHETLVTSYFTERANFSWTPTALHDQRIAGATLWCIAELIDLPFLYLVFRRWLRVDARDAATVDAVLEAERHARVALSPGDEHTLVPPDRDAPWWLSDPSMQQRLRRRE
ncbi:MAG: cytochrome c oxidase assembly protein [Jatrophihabitans sp.]